VRLHTHATLSNGGEAVARDPDGRVIFIEGAAPDEKVEIQITKSKKRFARGRVLQILEASSHRVEPDCEYFGSCGGCVTQHVHPDAQTHSKQEALLENLRRIGKLNLSHVEIATPWSGPAYGYRHRARLALAPGPLLGFRARASNKIIDIERCSVLTDSAQQALSEVRQFDLKVSSLEEFDLVANDQSALLRLAAHHRKSIEKTKGDAKTRFVFGSSTESINADDGRGRLLLSPGVFSQSNAPGNAAMIDYVSELMGSVEHLLELYAGSGNFTRMLIKQAQRVEIIEGDGPAVDLARKVLPPEVEIHAGSVEKIIAQRLDHGLAGVAVLADPPRTGLSETVVELLKKLQAKHLIYVSCDPANFARDLARLSPVYSLSKVRLFDLYPQTSHSEVVGLLKLV